MPDGFGMFFAIFPIFFFLVFALVVGGIITAIVTQARKAAANRAAPEVNAVGVVVDKRIETHGGDDSPIRQQHFVAFEQPGGERFELEVPATEYGLLVVGDRGTVTMKGTEYLAFAREIMR